MARRALEEINAGSMADIAFLLLIFFLVTTTMDTDEGIVRMLPQKLPDNMPEIKVRERDVFEILVNANNQLLVENEYIEMDQLKDKVKEFLTNPTDNPNLPEMVTISETFCKEEIGKLKDAMKDSINPLYNIWKVRLNDMENKLMAAEKVGKYRTVPDMAIISLRNDNNTTYETYVRVQDEMQKAINELRNEWAQRIYGENYTDWESDNEADQDKMSIIRAIIPQRIAEQQPKNIPGY